MSDINEKLDLIIDARDDMKIALEGKGQAVTKDIRTYAEAIANIEEGSGDVKLFDTVEHMQQDENPSEGDLAVVYREEVQPVTEESEFDSCIFPNEVVLDEVFSANINGSFRAVDQSVMFSGMVEMSSSNFRFNGYGESSEIRVEYESQDGITYTRVDSEEELVDFGVAIKWEDYGDPWNDVLGEFMKTSKKYFNGLFEYKVGYRDKSKIHFLLTSGLEIDSSSTINIDPSGWDSTYYDVDTLVALADKITLDFNISTYNSSYCPIFLIQDGDLCFIMKSNSYIYSSNLGIDENYDVIGVYSDSGTINSDIYLYKVTDITTGTYVLKNTYSGATLGYFASYVLIPDVQSILISCCSENDGTVNTSSNVYVWNGSSFNDLKTIEGLNIYKQLNLYIPAKSQLDTTNDCVYNEKIFYGKNGVESGILTNNVSDVFTDVNAEVYAKIQNQYDNMQPRVLTDQDRIINKNMRSIPCKSDGTPLLDTSRMTNMYNLFADCDKLVSIALLDTSNISNASGMWAMFAGCKSLITIPLLDTSSVTNMESMFSSCQALVSVPLLNTSNVTDMSKMFQECQSLVSVPLFDTGSVTTMTYMFEGCAILTTVPVFNTSSLKYMNNMFNECSSLSNDSLNNILTMCTNATSLVSTKTLKAIGLSQEQATTCQSLSNYQAFVNAGWTTGY